MKYEMGSWRTFIRLLGQDPGKVCFNALTQLTARGNDGIRERLPQALKN